MRIALGVEYDGHEFSGWQAQTGMRTIQGYLETALSIIADEPIKVFCAGRTDAGVHATGQVVHFETSAVRKPHAWVLGVNTHLPPTIAVRFSQIVDESFHARFSAQARRYQYIIYNLPVRSAILAARATWHHKPLDENLMQQAARYLVGTHDFSSFRSSQCDSKSPIRRVNSVKVSRIGDFVIIDIEANAFLHHMVRNIAGTLMRIGERLADPEWLQVVLMAKDRKAAGETASPTGLYLAEVHYLAPYLFPKAENSLLFLLR